MENGRSWWLRAGEAPGVIVLGGEIDFSVTPNVREKLLALVGDTPREIVLDMGDLAYIDSSGLAMLIELHRSLTESGRTVRIRALSSQVRKLFNLTQIGDLFGLAG